MAFSKLFVPQNLHDLSLKCDLGKDYTVSVKINLSECFVDALNARDL